MFVFCYSNINLLIVRKHRIEAKVKENYEYPLCKKKYETLTATVKCLPYENENLNLIDSLLLLAMISSSNLKFKKKLNAFEWLRIEIT